MHNGIIKENQLGKECFIHSHIFPSFKLGAAAEIDCSSQNKFKRISDEENLEELYDKGGVGSITRSKYKKQLEEAEKRAFEEGYAQGRSDGQVCGKKEIEPTLKKFEQALAELYLLKQNISVLAEKEAVDLSMAIAKKIVGNEIAVNKDVISHVVKEALQKVRGHENIKIKLNPDEIQIVKESNNELKNIANCVEDIKIIGDHTISPGGCIIETNIGDIDARIEKQFKVVEEAFKTECR